MGRILGFLVLLVILGVLGLIGYSYSGYLQPQQSEITAPVTLDVD
jgi:predicted negative regulator of RcsB-dependent stress response